MIRETGGARARAKSPARLARTSRKIRARRARARPKTAAARFSGRCCVVSARHRPRQERRSQMAAAHAVPHRATSPSRTLGDPHLRQGDAVRGLRGGRGALRRQHGRPGGEPVRVERMNEGPGDKLARRTPAQSQNAAPRPINRALEPAGSRQMNQNPQPRAPRHAVRGASALRVSPPCFAAAARSRRVPRAYGSAGLNLEPGCAN